MVAWELYSRKNLVCDPTLLDTISEPSSMHVSQTSVYYFAIYRPPPSPRNGFTTAEFLSEFDTFVDFVNSLNSKLIIAGDFNLHVDVPTKSDVSHFLTTVLSASLTQHVIGPTHDLGHTLDLGKVIILLLTAT